MTSVAFSGDLIVGNFGDGEIHAFARSGNGWHPDGVLRGDHSKPIKIDGLWGIAFGGGAVEQRPDEHAVLRGRSERRSSGCLRHGHATH